MNKSYTYELERIQNDMKAAFVRGSLTAAAFIILGVALAFVYFKYVKTPKIMLSNHDNGSQQTCPVEMQRAGAQTHVYNGKINPQNPQQTKLAK